MEPTLPNKPNTPLEPVDVPNLEVVPAPAPEQPVVDTSQLFMKDPEPVFAEPKKKFAFFAGKKKLLLLAIPLFLIMTGGLTFAMISNSADDTKSEDSISTSSESANDQQESSNNTESTAENPTETTNSDGIAIADPTSPTDSSTPTASSPSSTSPTGGGGSAPSTGGGTTTSTAKTYTITYSNSCYSPADLTIKFGDTIKFVNSTSNKNMWPASDDHPSHTIYPEFDPDRDIAPGSSWSFMFGKTGTWDYHDHVKPSCGGTITVT